MTTNILMLSSSRAGDETYLNHARPHILAQLQGISELLFIPYAGVSISWDDYTAKVQQALPEINVVGIHTLASQVDAVKDAKAIAVGGGNTFNLLATLYQQDLLDVIKSEVATGTRYIGWSAGSNICGQTIRTTNDMPIIAPASFDALGFVNAQLNPHYTDYQPPGHNGETRDDRLFEFTALNPTTPVIAIPEGTALKIENNSLTYVGELTGYVFIGDEKTPLAPNTTLNQYLL